MSTHQPTHRGFTLIELLVTIAIIGILASVILAALNDARTSGVDAKLQLEMDSIAKRASISFSTEGDYDRVCASNGETQDDRITTLVTSLTALATAAPVCNSTVVAYAVSVPLTGGGHWCVDATGVKKEIPNALVAGVTLCPS